MKKAQKRLLKGQDRMLEHIIDKYKTTIQAKKTLEKGILRCEGSLSTLEVLIKELSI